MLDLQRDSDWSEGWTALDRFVGQWLQTDFTRDLYSAHIGEIERSAAITLPASMRSWCAFVIASQRLAHFVWRDCLAIKPVPGHAALSLLIQGEADYYWAIQSANLIKTDPAVVGYYLDYDSEESEFSLAGTWAPTVSAFALDYFLSYLQSPGGGFSVRQSSASFHREKLLTEFGLPRHFGHLELFHCDGVLAVLGGLPPSWRHNVISFEIQTPRPFKQLPSLVQELFRDAYSTHGGLHEYR